jgi:hypothetical protein
MEIRSMEFHEYCCLNRTLLRIDEEADAQWFFGNREVEQRLLDRIDSDFNTRGVPKCGILGRWGIGKTHTLNHLKLLFERNPNKYRAKPVKMHLAPWDDSNPRGNNWGYIHRKMIDSIGEHLLREIVIAFDKLPEARTQNLASSMESILRFGDANLKFSLAVVLADNFLREQKSTALAWEWLRGGNVRIGDLGVNRIVESVQDMVDIVRNIGILAKKATNMGFVFLIDEAHALADVKKKEREIHYGFKELADQSNSDAGFVLAIFGGGMNVVPHLLVDPKDILDRMGVTSQTVNEAIIDLKDVTARESDLKEFAMNVLENLKDRNKANLLIKEFALDSKTTPELIPYTTDGLAELVTKLNQKEETRAPRLIIDNLATVANRAYQEAKARNEYILINAAFVRKSVI